MGDSNPVTPELLSPYELRNAMRSALKGALEDMDSDEFLDALEELPEQERKAAAITRGEVFRAWRRLNNQQLEEIRELLADNEAVLRRAAGELTKARAKVDEVAAFLNTANQFLNVAARVISPV
jgi:hypothetical protein